MIAPKTHVSLVIPFCCGKTIVRDYAGGLGFEANSGYFLPPLDHMQLAACIDGTFSVSIIDAQAEGMLVCELSARLKDLRTGLVICEISIPTLRDDVLYASEIARLGIPVIGRVHSHDPSLLKEILSDTGISMCLVGECEDIVVDILLGLDNRGTARILNDEIVVKTKPFIEDLDALPFPRRDLCKSVRYCYPKLGECTTVQSSRGCPYACSYYCPYPLTQGTKWRCRSSKSVIEEIGEINRLGIRKILFRDPVFTLDVGRTHEICRDIRESGFNIEWWCETRADLLPEDLLEAMAAAGCKGINVGVESGDTALRLATLKPGVSDEMLLAISEKAREVGIGLAFLLMVGFPNESRTSILGTASLLRRCRPHAIGVGFPVHHPGTQLEKDAIANKWLIQPDYASTDGSLPVLASCGLSRDEMIAGRDLLLRLFQAIQSEDPRSEAGIFKEVTTWARRKSGEDSIVP